MNGFLPGDRPWWSTSRWWQPAFAMIVVVALTVAGLHWLAPVASPDHPVTAEKPSPADAQTMASTASSAFTGTAMASDDTLSAAARSANIPTDPVAGWDLPTTDGRRVQLVLPAGLGAGEPTPDGQVVYPDRGAGFSVIAENKGTGGRTITRIPKPAANATAASGAATADGQALPTVPMFLRTPPDTVMLAHTDGTITVNQATPAATTIATIAAPQARDSHGTPVPSAFVTQRIRPGLYLLAQVIRPDAATVWPVYADPCISACDAFTHASTSGANGAALQAAGSALVTGIKNNPVESAEIIGGGALMVTGVGSGFGASLVLSGTTGLVQKAAAADPTDQMLGLAGDALEVTNYISPARAVQKGLTAVVERGAQKIGDDVAEGALRDATVVKPVTPTPSPQLANDIAGAATPKPGVSTPKIPTGPPSTAPTVTGTKFPDAVKDQAYADATDARGNLHCDYCGSRVFRQEGRTQAGDQVPPDRAQIDHYYPRKLGGDGVQENAMVACRLCNGAKSGLHPDEWEAVRADVADESRLAISEYQRIHGTQPDGVVRTSNIRPGQHRGIRADTTQSFTDRRRNAALNTARAANNATENNGEESSTRPNKTFSTSNGSTHRTTKKQQPKKVKKQSTTKKHRKGQK
ncbi:HNH endonuclease [Mycolicibacterium anyangense]|uniref:HNH endonuclease n=1 Tax=Mycolicibacterium anyangense TaxID=1431246 RepID=A0A6N4WGZ2_9MYCO|nr:HNH endonuclease [Mycolicibacterium anyangense]BBZ78471.1 HNH endonuclease [Mycolicibacterium anyangense]